MTTSEYRKILYRLPQEAQQVLLNALNEYTDGDWSYSVPEENKAIARQMWEALALDEVKKAPPITFDFRPEKGQLLITIRSDEPRDILAIKQEFLNKHLIEGEWPISKQWSSEDRIFTTYDCRRKEKVKRKTKEAEPSNPLATVLHAMGTLSADQKKQLQAMLNQ